MEQQTTFSAVFKILNKFHLLFGMDHSNQDLMSASITQAAFQSDISMSDGTIVYLPEGHHSISATVGGKPKRVEVNIDERIAASFTEDLSKRFESNVRPFAGFDHKQGPASFIPKEFRYESGVGLVLDVEWTEAGRKAIEGKDYSYFSPTFLLSDSGVPFGLPPRGEIGSLVNDPAFEEIPRIAASHTEPIMDITNLVELGLVEASESPETAIETAKAVLANLREIALNVETTEAAAVEAATVAASSAESYASLKEKFMALEEENAALKKQMATKAAANAELAIDEAIKAGRIAPQDEDAKSFWLTSILADEKAMKVLASLPSNDALTGKTILAGRTEDAPQLSGMARVEAAIRAQSQL